MPLRDHPGSEGDDHRRMARGTLRTDLGAAPGVGKTYAMLGEAHRRQSGGADVVVGLVETHGRPRTREQLEGLDVLPRGTPRDGPVVVRVGAVAGRVELRVIDRGPGVAEADRERFFAPFQGLGDAPAGQGVGLGPAAAPGRVARV